MHSSSAFLRRVLAVDAIGCAISGVALLVAAETVAALTALPVSLVEGAGAVLLPFSALVGWTASRETPPVAGVRAVIAVNMLWVAESLLVAGGAWTQPNSLGTAIVVGQALVGAILTHFEVVGLRRMRMQLI